MFKIDDTRYADGDEIALTNFGLIAFFSEAKVTNSSGKHPDKVYNLHTVNLKNNILPSQQQTRELLYGFEESEAIR